MDAVVSREGKMKIVILECEFCGKSFERRASYQKHLEEKRGIFKKFCSKECKNKASIKEFPEDEAKTLYESGFTLAEVAQRYNISPEKIRKKFLSLGIEIRANTYHMSFKNPTKGVGHKPESIEKMRKAAIKQFSDPQNREKASHNQIKFMGQGTHRGVSSLEDVVAEILDSLRVQYKRQYAIKDSKGVYRACVDFFLEPNIVIEVNGTYWHADPRVYKKMDSTQKRANSRYQKKMQHLNMLGFVVKELWEIDIRENAIDAISAVLKN